MSDPYFQKLFADRIGGAGYGKGTDIYKFEKIKRAKRQALAEHPDRELLDFGIGENDEMAPENVRQQMAVEINKPENRGYADNGIPTFREAAARFMQREFGVGLDPKTQVIPTIGTKSALAMLPAPFINPGDVTLMTVPGYPVIGSHTTHYGGVVYKMPLLAENDFLPDLEAVPADVLAKAKDFVTGMQYGRAKRDPNDPWYGGASYGGQGRPDLSNTGYLIEALRSVEAGPDDPAIQAALRFVSRTQNLDSKYNDTPLAGKVDDGGFYYEIPKTKIDPSTSPERYTPDGGLRSYGSMTYTGLKSMIYAGLTSEDPRVKAAVQWVTDHYDVQNNPGMGSAGLYYYYHTFAAALKTAGLKTVTDADGQTHRWRADLVAELAERQNDDGSWSNENRRWFENDKNLATAFALMALAYCDPPRDAG